VIDKFNNKKLFPHRIIHQQFIKGEKLVVKESAKYRWFEYAGCSIQSIMSLANPVQIVMPVTQSFLLFLLINPKASNILNLGLGGASLERCLGQYSEFSITSIESSPSIVDMAKEHFLLTNLSNVICTTAEEFVASSHQQYDVILSDLFIGEQGSSCLLEEQFYQQLMNIITENGLVLINLYVENDQKLTDILLTIRKYFSYLALVEFKDFSNIVVIASRVGIASQQQLQKNKLLFTEIDWQEIDDIIEQITYLPACNTKRCY